MRLTLSTWTRPPSSSRRFCIICSKQDKVNISTALTDTHKVALKAENISDNKKPVVRFHLVFVLSFVFYSLHFHFTLSTLPLGDSTQFNLKDTDITHVNVSHPVWQVADSLIGHKLQNTTVGHSVWVLVRQLEQHWIGDIKPACRRERRRKVIIIEGSVRVFIMKRCLIWLPLTELVESWRRHYYWGEQQTRSC